ncbi:hypothetical protein MLC52_09760 [Sulfurimonas sp. NW15]|uniref:hypothetical protein n=1 Tax=Sulfurimonas TaxID=202746 RepID=UPI00125FAB32|nr:hypothetical protein [Sulfurimonas hydrogeniphila]
MKNTAVKTKEKYERKLAKAISKSGGITLTNNGANIDYVSLAEPKGLYAVDNFDIELVAVEAIVQEVSTGKVFAFNEEFGVMGIEFDFMGSKEDCYKYLLDDAGESKKENLAETIASIYFNVHKGKEKIYPNEVIKFEEV